ncbi:hypothetical protein BDZ97DRAFT_1753566 [Flammula alnicola]|nr:hypothetical protein BDZ97DRAFT_1753566 [Flammula alnicola]
MSQLKDDHKVVLPYELERDIFELAARAFPGYALELATISRYVQQWTEALIYETVVLESPLATDLFLRTFDARPPSFFAKNVKRLYLTEVVSFYEAQRILARCTGVTEATCWVYPHSFKDNLLPQLPTHDLQRLSIPLEALWGMSPLLPHFTASLFPNLSHLEIVNPPAVHPTLQIDWDGLVALPRLTHLALGELCYDNHAYFIPPLGRLLDECQQLKGLVLLTCDKLFIDALRKSGIDTDFRVLVQPEFHCAVTISEHWKGVRQGGPDFWNMAESLLQLAQTCRDHTECAPRQSHNSSLSLIQS